MNCEECSEPAVIRVKLYDLEGITEVDLCRNHLDMIAPDYPDNIKTIKDYAE